MNMEFIPIKEDLKDNEDFLNHPDRQDSLYMSIDFFKKVGYTVPWIGYYAAINHVLVGCAAFKGKPISGKVEIAYGTFPQHQRKGVTTEICKKLLVLSLKTNASIRVTARTLAEENFSTKVLRKNGFERIGMVHDDEDGDVWEWEYKA